MRIICNWLVIIYYVSMRRYVIMVAILDRTHNHEQTGMKHLLNIVTFMSKNTSSKHYTIKDDTIAQSWQRMTLKRIEV
jgi:hypothetical protein